MNPADLVLYVRRAIRCNACGATGRILDYTTPYGRGFATLPTVSRCSECDGTGYVVRHVRAEHR